MSYKKVSDWAQEVLPGFGCLISVASACRTLLRFDRHGKVNTKVSYEEWLWFNTPLCSAGDRTGRSMAEWLKRIGGGK